MLDLGYDGPVELREIDLRKNTAAGISIMYLSDLHFNRFSAALAKRLIALIEQCRPDLLLLGGDYVDTRRGLPHLEALLKTLKNGGQALAIAGNHDYYFGVERIKNLMLENGVFWLEKSSRQVNIRGVNIQIDTRQSMGTTGAADFRILCLHEPAPLNSPYDLVLAGHLHGSQVVLWQNARGLFPGRWFYRWNLLEKQLGECRYVVSRGLGDTLPLRFNCAREGVLVMVDKGL